MLVVDNKVIETPIRDLLELLRQQLYVYHIDKLNRVEYKQRNARITCPIHKGGHENTPSCDVLLEDKGDIPAGTVSCFACGYRASFVKFVGDCLEIPYRQAAEWVLSISKYSLLEDIRDVPEVSLNDKKKDNYDLLPKVTLNELKSYDYIHPYMFKRHLTDELIEKFEVGFDPKTDCLTFPVYVNGTCLFVAKRSVKSKRFIMPKDLHPKPIYGLDYITEEDVYVCESILNALIVWKYGKQAVALLGTGSNEQIEMLNNSGIRHFILALDGDESGRNGTKRLINGLSNSIVTVLHTPTDGRDINDLTEEEFNSLEETIG